MIYLILKIFGYLLIAVLAGFASGWLLRNLLAVKKDEELHSSLNDARAKLPQFESLLRGRDQQVIGLKDDLERESRRSESSWMQRTKRKRRY